MMIFFAAFVAFFDLFWIVSAKISITTDIDSGPHIRRLDLGFYEEVATHDVEEFSDWPSYSDLFVTIDPPTFSVDEEGIYQRVALYGSPVYVLANLPTVDDSIVLSVKVIAKILNGSITNWKDSEILDLNPDITGTIDDLDITVIIAEDSHVISALEPTFESALGTAFVVKSAFNVKSFEMVDSIYRKEGTFAICSAGAFHGTPTKVKVVNQKGKSIEATVENAIETFGENSSLFLTPGESVLSYGTNAYPLVVAHFGILKKSLETTESRTCTEVNALVDFLISILDDARFYRILHSIGCVAQSYFLADKIIEELLGTTKCDETDVVPLSVHDIFQISAAGVGHVGIFETLSSSIYRHVMGERSVGEMHFLYEADSVDDVVQRLENDDIDVLTAFGGDSSLEFNVPIVQIPIAQFSLQLILHLPEVGIQDQISMSQETMKLFLSGCIGEWSDYRIQNDNPSLSLPKRQITLVDIGYSHSLTRFDGSLCDGNVEATVVTMERFVTQEYLCDIDGGAMMVAIERDGSMVDGFEPHICNDITVVKGINLKKSDGQVMLPNAELLDSCESIIDFDKAMNRGCWPFTGSVEFIFKRDFTGAINNPLTYQTTCSFIGQYLNSFKEHYLDDSFALNFNGLRLGPVPYHTRIIVVDLIETMTCAGKLLFSEDSGSDIDFIVYVVIAFSMFGILTSVIAITKLSHKNQSQKRSEEDLIKQMEKDQIRLNEASRMMAWVNHEIRNLLNGVMGLSMFARDTLQEAQEQSSLRRAQELIGNAMRDVTTVVQSSQLMSVMVNDVMKLRQLEEGKLSSTKTQTNICKVINTVLKVFRPKFNEKPNVKVVVTTYTNASEENLHIDAVHSMQILANFVGNAIKFTDDGSIRIVARKIISVKGTRLRIEVHDTGPGIPDDLKSGIFQQRWVQAETKERANGSGFGLYLCHGLATKILKGCIGFESIVSIGSTFWFEVPIEQNRNSNNGLVTPIDVSTMREDDGSDVEYTVSDVNINVDGAVNIKTPKGSIERASSGHNQHRIRRVTLSTDVPSREEEATIQDRRRGSKIEDFSMVRTDTTNSAPPPDKTNPVYVHDNNDGMNQDDVLRLQTGQVLSTAEEEAAKTKSDNRQKKLRTLQKATSSRRFGEVGCNPRKVSSASQPEGINMDKEEVNKRFSRKSYSAETSNEMSEIARQHTLKAGQSRATALSILQFGDMIGSPSHHMLPRQSPLVSHAQIEVENQTLDENDRVGKNNNNNSNINGNNNTLAMMSLAAQRMHGGSDESNERNFNNQQKFKTPNGAVQQQSLREYQMKFDNLQQPHHMELAHLKVNEQPQQQQQQQQPQSVRRPSLSPMDMVQLDDNIRPDLRQQQQQQQQSCRHVSLSPTYHNNGGDFGNNHSMIHSSTHSLTSPILSAIANPSVSPNSRFTTNPLTSRSHKNPQTRRHSLHYQKPKLSKANGGSSRSIGTSQMSVMSPILELSPRSKKNLTSNYDEDFDAVQPSSPANHFREMDHADEQNITELFSGKYAPTAGTDNVQVNGRRRCSTRNLEIDAKYHSLELRAPSRRLSDGNQSCISVATTRSFEIRTPRSANLTNNSSLKALQRDCASPVSNFPTSPPSQQQNPSVPMGMGSSQQRGSSKPLEGAIILVVDDSPVNRLILRRCLSKAGAKIIEACDGQDAVEKWTSIQNDPSKQNIDLIWMDVLMPKMLGTEASIKLREIGCTCGIIACTGNVQEEDHNTCLSSGMTRLEPKPLNISRAVKVSKYCIENPMGNGSPEPSPSNNNR